MSLQKKDYKIQISGILIAILIIIADQFTKYYFFNLLSTKDGNIIEVSPFFNLVMVMNYGVSFGMFNSLDNGHIILSAIGIIITFGLIYWIFKSKKYYEACAIGLIIGGAIGNIIDRIRMQAVADFLDFYVGNYHWPAFNLADSAVFVGVCIILLESFFIKDDKNANNP